MPPKPKRKQQSAKPPANQKGEKSRKEAEKEVAKESAMVAVEAPKELANVATMEAEEEVAKESLVFNKLVDYLEEKEQAVVVHEVSQEVLVEKEVNLEVPQQVAEQEGAMEGEYLIPVAKGSSHNSREVSEAESAEGLSHDEVIKIHCMQEHDRQQKKKAGVPLPPSQDTCQIWLELKKVPHLIIGDTNIERDKDRLYLVGLTKLQRVMRIDCDLFRPTDSS
jgi:hypothetical protein